MGDLDTGTLSGKLEIIDTSDQVMKNAEKNVDDLGKKFDELDVKQKQVQATATALGNDMVAAADKAAKSWAATNTVFDDAGNRILPSTRKRLAEMAAAAEQASKPLEDYSVLFKKIETTTTGLTFSDVRAGLNGIAEGAGLTVEKLGAVNTVGALIGAGYGGWKIGRIIADFFKLDETIGNATAKLLGFGDVGAEAAAAKADVLAKASEIAGRTITDLTEAIKINNAAFAEQQANFKDFGNRLAAAKEGVMALTDAQKEDIKAALELGISHKDIATQLHITEDVLKEYIVQSKEEAETNRKSAAAAKEAAKEHAEFAKVMGELNAVGASAKETILGIDGAVVEAIKYYIQAGVSQGDLAKAYGLTATQVKAVATVLKDEDEANKKNEESTKKLTKAKQEFQDALSRVTATGQGYEKVLETIDGRVVEGAKYYLQHGASLKDVAEIYGLTEAQAWALGKAVEAATEAAKKHTASLKAEQDAAASTKDMVHTLSGEYITLAEAKKRASIGNSMTYDLTTKGGIDEYRRLNPGAQINLSDEQIMAFAQKGGTLQQLVQQGQINPYGAWGTGSGFIGGSTPTQPFPNYPTTIEPQLSVTPNGSTVASVNPAARVAAAAPAGGIMSGSPVNIYISSYDAQHTAQVVSDKIIQSALAVRQFGSASR